MSNVETIALSICIVFQWIAVAFMVWCVFRNTGGKNE